MHQQLTTSLIFLQKEKSKQCGKLLTTSTALIQKVFAISLNSNTRCSWLCACNCLL